MGKDVDGSVDGRETEINTKFVVSDENELAETAEESRRDEPTESLSDLSSSSVLTDEER